MITVTHDDATTFTAEGGGWLTVRRSGLALCGESAADLLRRTRDLPGNLRHALDAQGRTVLMAEGRIPDGEPFEEARDRLDALLEGPADSAPAPTDEALEAALEGTGFTWSRRQGTWVVTVKEGLPREVLLRPAPGGARAEAVLAEWDEIDPTCAGALAQFLLAAQGGLRCARCELEEGRAVVAGFAPAGRLDADLEHALLGVAAGTELLAREATALLRPELAQRYLEHRRISF